MRRHLRWLLPATALLLVSAPVSASASSSPPAVPRCPLTTDLAADASSVTLHSGTTPRVCGAQVGVEVWWTHDLAGLPLTSQVFSQFWEGVFTPEKIVTVPLPSKDPRDCFRQIDVFYGHAKSDLSVPFGQDLITAWHLGTVDCLAIPTTPPPSASATPTTPAPVPSATVPVPSSPPVVTTPAPVPSSVTPTTAPPVTTRPALPPHKVKPTHKPKPRPTPTQRRVTPAPAPPTPCNGEATGSIGSLASTAPAIVRCYPSSSPPPADTLPFTGVGDTLKMTLVGAAALVLGLGLLAYSRRRSS